VNPHNKTLLIVDDETPIREWIAACVKHYPGISQVETARNGEEALKVLRRQPVDIVLTDITMPRMDGIALLRQIKEELPDITVVIMSVHHDFEHVRNALKMGAYDYILKNEITPDDLFAILDRIIKNQAHLPDVKETAPAAVDPIIRAQYIHSLLADPDQTIQPEDLRRYKIDLQDGPLLVLALPMVPETLPEIDRELNSHLHQMTFLTYGKTRLLILANCDAGQDWVDRLAQIIGLVVGSPIGCSRLKPGIKDLLPAIREALAQCDRQFYGPSGRLEFPARSREEEKSIKQDLERKLNQVVEHYRQHRCDKAIQEFQLTLAQLEQFLIQDVEYIRDMLAMTIHRLFIGSKTLDIDNKSYENQIQSARNLTELKRVLDPLFEKMAACETYPRPIAEAIAFIGQRFMHSISLVDVAEAVHLNEEYFSRLFKKEVGINFTDYLLNLRMETAHSLLMSTDLKIAAIAEKVGISDSKYFSLLFKKTFDQTPSQVRDRQ